MKSMKKILIVANWKMNPRSLKEAKAILEAVKKEIRTSKETEVVICPPFIFLPLLSGWVRGGQNCHWENTGAYTGEISPLMLADAGVQYVILGHSERRRLMGETNDIINLKIKAAIKARLKPILCVGESDGEEMAPVLEEQISQCLADLGPAQIKDLIIAYEPAWAIGTGNNCQPENAQSAALFIKKTLTKIYSRFAAEKIPLLYGGSVNCANAADYLKVAGMDGLLAGGASLDAKEFSAIIKCVQDLN